ncbi:hypothetical protein VTH06DRAFT_3759 [Thermothelomyces fergusii]
MEVVLFKREVSQEEESNWRRRRPFSNPETDSVNAQNLPKTNQPRPVPPYPTVLTRTAPVQYPKVIPLTSSFSLCADAQGDDAQSFSGQSSPGQHKEQRESSALGQKLHRRLALSK